MGLIIFLVLLGVFFLVVEMMLLPGVTIGTILSIISYAVAVYIGFDRFGITGGGITLAAVIIVSLVAIIISLRGKTWRRLSLKQKIESSSMETPSDTVKVGDRGTTLSRLSPMGKILIDGRVYEAKSIDAYIDQRSEVEVVGFENFTVIVKRMGQNRTAANTVRIFRIDQQNIRAQRNKTCKTIINQTNIRLWNCNSD